MNFNFYTFSMDNFINIYVEISIKLRFRSKKLVTQKGKTRKGVDKIDSSHNSISIKLRCRYFISITFKES